MAKFGLNEKHKFAESMLVEILGWNFDEMNCKTNWLHWGGVDYKKDLWEDYGQPNQINRYVIKKIYIHTSSNNLQTLFMKYNYNYNNL